MKTLRFALLVVVVPLSFAAVCFSAEKSEKASDPAALPPAINFKPGPEYADSVRMFQGIPSLAGSPNGRLWATWYGGGVTEDHYNYVMLVTSGDDGQTWLGLKLVIDPDGDGPVRAFDSCPWLDPGGRLWLFWAQRGGGLPYLHTLTTDNPDDETPTWSKPRLICPGIMMCKPTVTRDGDWLLPTAIWGREGSCRVMASTDRGKTWTLRGAATVPDRKDRNCDEPMIVQRRDGSLWMWVRTRYGIGQCTSTDGGRTWSEVVPSEIAHPAARFFVRRLASGSLLLIKHGPIDKRTGRSHLTAYVSQDDGRTWQGGLLLDERTGVSYPDGFQKDDGRIYVIRDYDRAGDKEILMSVFTEDDVLAGKDVSGKVRLRVLINQATGKNPRLQAKTPKNVKLNPHSDGAPPLKGAGAELKPLREDDRVAAFTNSVKLFTDRTYVASNLPQCVTGRKYVRASINGTSVEVVHEGIVFAVTPLPNRNKDSVAAQLQKEGFQKAAVPEFLLFGSSANICTTFQKRVRRGERITIGKWGVVSF